MIYLGDKKAGSICLGDKKLSKIYLGDKLVWEGYKKGHIVGTGEAGTVFSTTVFGSDGKRHDIVTHIDNNGKFDIDLSFVFGPRYSAIFCNNAHVYTVDSFSVTIAGNPSDSKLDGLFYNCNHLISANISRIKVTNPIDLSAIFYRSSVQYIYTKGFPWDKITTIEYCFKELPNLKELDLSGANFDNVEISIRPYFGSYCFKDIGSVGTIIKVIGCSETTQNKILSTLNDCNTSQTWELKNGIITRTE